MGFFDTMGVFEQVHRSEQQRTQGKIIGTRWIDTNKGDPSNPRIRSQLVGKELEALRLVLNKAATLIEGEEMCSTESLEEQVEDLSLKLTYVTLN